MAWARWAAIKDRLLGLIRLEPQNWFDREYIDPFQPPPYVPPQTSAPDILGPIWANRNPIWNFNLHLPDGSTIPIVPLLRLPLVSPGTWTNDSPSAGSVSWSSAIVAHEGESYQVADGNTALKYIWWDKTYPVTFQVSDTQPSLNPKEDLLICYNAGGIAKLALMSDLIQGGFIVAGAITADKISVGQLSAIAADMGLLTAGEVRLGTGTPGTDFTGLRLYKSGTTYRLEGRSADVLRAYFDSDGRLKLGAGNIIADEESLRSGNFAEGVSGWKISPDGKAEFDDIRARGEIRASAFKYGTISAVGGKLVMSEATPLIADVAAAGTSIDVTDQAFQTNDLVHLQDVIGGAVQLEWMRILNIGTAITGGFRYTVTRNLDGSGANDWKKGTAVIEKGYSDGVSSYGGAWIELAGDEAGGELLQSFKRTGILYNAYTKQVWIDVDGKLKAGGGSIIFDGGGMTLSGAAYINFTEPLQDTFEFKYGTKYGSIDFVAGVFSLRAKDDDLFLMTPSGKAIYIGTTYALWDVKIEPDGGIITLDGTSGRLYFGTSATGLLKGASGDLTFKDAIAGTQTLDYLAKGECARVYHSVAQATVSGVSLALAFDSERFDTDAIHDTVTNNSRLTCKTAGKYLIIGCADIDVNATGDREIYIRLGGATYIASDARRAPATKDAHMNLSVIYDLAVNEYVELLVRQDSGVALNSEAWPNAIPEFMMVRVG